MVEIPRVKIYETSGGYAPIKIGARNRQGFIAPFSRGPANFLSYVSGYTDFSEIYGVDSSIGSLAFQSSWDQGGREFALYRIVGSEKTAKGSVAFKGYSSKPNNISLHLGFIGPAVSRSKKRIKSNILTTGIYSGSNTGRYWFRVLEIDREGFAKVAYIFMPLGVEGYLNWYPEYRDSSEFVVHPSFPDDLKNLILDDIELTSRINKPLLKIKSAKPKEFSDGCLELGEPGEVCSLATVVGWQVIVEAGQLRWVYNVDNSGVNLRLDKASSGFIGNIPVAVNTPGGEQPAVITDTTSSEDISDMGTLMTGFSGNILPDVYEVSKSFIFNLKEDKGTPIPGEAGMFMTFDTMNSPQDIQLQVGDMWTVKVESIRHDVPIYEGITPSQVLTAIEQKLAGVTPLDSEFVRNDRDDGLLFNLEPERGGSDGNRYSYYWDLQEPDGEVICDCSFFSGEKYIQVPIQFATYIQPGATLFKLETPGVYGVTTISNPFLIDANEPNNLQFLQPNTKVTKVEIPTYGGGLAVVWLDKEVSSSFDSIGTFHFHNPLGLTMTHYTWNQACFMTGGEDGARRSEIDFYSIEGIPLLKIIANSEGDWGNGLRINLYPIDNERLNISIVDLNKGNYDPPIKDESFTFRFKDTDGNGFLTAFEGSKLIKGLFLPKYFNPLNYNINLESKTPMRLAPADETIIDPNNFAHPEKFGIETLTNVSLEGGYDGPPLTDEDYILALERIRIEPIHILCCPGVSSMRVKARMAAQAANSTPSEGQRIALLNASPNLAPNAAQRETANINVSQAMMIAGWSSYAGVEPTPRFSLSPDSLMAGMLSSKPFFISPHARTSAGSINGISEVDTDKYNSNSQLQVYSSARLEVLHLDQTNFGYFFLNGRSLSSDTQWEKIVYRRTFQILAMDLYGYLQQFKGEPNNGSIIRRIKSGIDSYLDQRVRNGQIRNYSPTIIDNQQPASRYIKIVIGVIPQYHIDYIDLELRRDDEGSVTGTNNVALSGF